MGKETEKKPETPPRMRGRLQSLAVKLEEGGNTPAYAGKTLRWRRSSLTRWKHPRVCGEDQYMTAIKRNQTETPPRMRGRPIFRSRRKHLIRNTPAYAGKTK